MIIHTTPLFTAYFGTLDDGLSADQYRYVLQEKSSDLVPFTRLKTVLDIQDLVLLRQVHSAQGVIVSAQSLQNVTSFAQEGDFLLTNTSVAVGVLTADCLPIILHDKLHNIVGVIHAGWRGLAQAIVYKTVEAMHKEYATNIKDVQVLFGPSAKICCYKVSENFLDNFDTFPNLEHVMIHHGGEFFFDLPGVALHQLVALGFKKEAIHLEYNSCTICTPTFNSVRRQGEQAGRQITAVYLR